MGVGNRQTLREDIERRVDDTANAIAADSDINDWIALAIRTIWLAWAWPFSKKRDNTLATTKDVATVNLPNDTQRIKKVYDKTSNRPLLPRGERVLQSLYDPTDRGAPLFYTDGGFSQPSDMSARPTRVLRFYPTPDAAYSLEVTYVRTPPEMDADADFPPLPSDFDEAIMQWVMRPYLLKAGDVQGSVIAKSNYDDDILRLIEVHGRDSHEQFPLLEYTDATSWD